MRRSIILLMVSIIISGCNAQNNGMKNQTKGDKQMEITDERIDTLDFHLHKKGDEYIYQGWKGTVRQYKVGDYYYELIRKTNDLFDEYRKFFSNGKLKTKGYYYRNRFEAGIWKYYNEQGKLINEIDYDEPFKNYPWEEVRKFLERERGVDFFDERTYVRRYFDESKVPVYNISWRSKDHVCKNIVIDVNKREVIKEEVLKPRK